MGEAGPYSPNRTNFGLLTPKLPTLDIPHLTVIVDNRTSVEFSFRCYSDPEIDVASGGHRSSYRDGVRGEAPTDSR